MPFCNSVDVIASTGRTARNSLANLRGPAATCVNHKHVKIAKRSRVSSRLKRKRLDGTKGLVRRVAFP